MKTIPKITEQEINQRVGDASFIKAHNYFKNGTIFNARKQGRKLKAQCEGSMPHAYRVQVDFNTKGIEKAHCSCPVGEGGYCKHVAALLLTWINQPDSFREVEEIDKSLEGRSKEELINLIQLMLNRHPDLEILLETPLPGNHKRKLPVDTEPYRRQIRNHIFHRDYHWDEESYVSSEIDSIIDIGSGFLHQGDVASAIAVLTAIIQEVADNYEGYHDEDGYLAMSINNCVELLGEILSDEENYGKQREDIFRTLFDIHLADIKCGGVGLGDGAVKILVELTSPEERLLTATWARDEIDHIKGGHSDWGLQTLGRFILEMEKDTLDDEAFLDMCRETRQTHDLIDRLLHLGRLEEASQEAKGLSDYYLLQAADLFIQHKKADIALKLILERSKSSNDTRLDSWLHDYYIKKGDNADALAVLITKFAKYPNMKTYQELKKLARKLGEWKQVHKDCLEVVEKKQDLNLLINIYLLDKNVEKALKTLNMASSKKLFFHNTYGPNLRLEVAKAAEDAYPNESLAIYKPYAEQLISARGRGNYQEACKILQTVKKIYKKLKNENEWQQYIQELRNKNKTLRALKEELNKHRL